MRYRHRRNNHNVMSRPAQCFFLSFFFFSAGNSAKSFDAVSSPSLRWYPPPSALSNQNGGATPPDQTPSRRRHRQPQGKRHKTVRANKITRCEITRPTTMCTNFLYFFFNYNDTVRTNKIHGIVHETCVSVRKLSVCVCVFCFLARQCGVSFGATSSSTARRARATKARPYE